jgi:hypothetical protein
VCSDSLPHQNRNHEKRRADDADAQPDLHFTLKSITDTNELLLMDCFFLAAACGGRFILHGATLLVP